MRAALEVGAGCSPPLLHCGSIGDKLPSGALFGISFVELLVVLLVALVVLGPDKLPPLLRTVGGALGRLRRITSELRSQTGIDDLLRREGLTGGLEELRQLMRGEFRPSSLLMPVEPTDGSSEAISPYSAASLGTNHTARTVDISRERPVEGCDAGSAIAEDLLVSPEEPTVSPSLSKPPSGPAPLPRNGAS